jgi:hypothetical protein
MDRKEKLKEKEHHLKNEQVLEENINRYKENIQKKRMMLD